MNPLQKPMTRCRTCGALTRNRTRSGLAVSNGEKIMKFMFWFFVAALVVVTAWGLGYRTGRIDQKVFCEAEP